MSDDTRVEVRRQLVGTCPSPTVWVLGTELSFPDLVGSPFIY